MQHTSVPCASTPQVPRTTPARRLRERSSVENDPTSKMFFCKYVPEDQIYHVFKVCRSDEQLIFLLKNLCVSNQCSMETAIDTSESLVFCSVALPDHFSTCASGLMLLLLCTSAASMRVRSHLGVFTWVRYKNQGAPSPAPRLESGPCRRCLVRQTRSRWVTCWTSR